MKKKVVAFVVAVGMLLSVVGCGGTSNSESSTSQGEAISDETETNGTAETSDNSEEMTIVLCAKTEGFKWFDATREGIEAFGKDFGVNAYQVAPDGGDVASQIQLVEDLIAQDVDAICIIPNDSQAMIPVIQKAREKGIVVITHEAVDIAAEADYDMESVDFAAVGQWYVDNMEEATGNEGGEWVMMVQALGATSMMMYYENALNYIEESNITNLTEVTDEPLEDQNSEDTAYDITVELMKKYPDLKVICSGGAASSGVARALQEKNSDVALIGAISPSTSAEYIKSGNYYNAWTWNPYGVGYTLGELAYKVVNGEPIDENLQLTHEDYKSLTVDGNIITADALVEVSADNIDEFDW